jgi:hypothetical protein
MGGAMVGRHYNFGRKETPPAGNDQAKRLAECLCSADFKRGKTALTLSFDDARSRDLAYAELMRLREAGQRL